MFLTIKEAATSMSCSTRTVKRMLSSGDLQFIEVGVGSRKSIRVKLPDPKTKDPAKSKRRKEYVGEVLTRR